MKIINQIDYEILKESTIEFIKEFTEPFFGLAMMISLAIIILLYAVLISVFFLPTMLITLIVFSFAGIKGNYENKILEIKNKKIFEQKQNGESSDILKEAKKSWRESDSKQRDEIQRRIIENSSRNYDE